jgi:hypothetical protein
MSSVANSSTPDEPATRSDVAFAIRQMALANPGEARRIDPDSPSPHWLAEPWLKALQAAFDVPQPSSRVREAGLRAAANHPGIALWNLTEEIRALDPEWRRDRDGRWVNDQVLIRTLKAREGGDR